MIDALEKMDLAYPEVDEAKKADLAQAKDALESAMKRGNEQLERFEKASKAAAL